MKHSVVIVVLILGIILSGVVDASSLGVPDSEKVRAVYWGLGTVEEGRRRLQRLKDRGLNMALVKEGNYHITADLWQDWAHLASEIGIYLVPVINLAGPDEIKHLQGRFTPYVGPDGKVNAQTPCPLDQAYWNTALGARLGELANLAIDASFSGLAFDTEMYGADFTLHSNFCYCDTCWQTFLYAHINDESLREQALRVAKSERYAYLYAQNLMPQYDAFQRHQLQVIAHDIEQRFHARHPDIFLGLLPYKNNWFYDALVLGFGTTQHPVFVLSESSYVLGYTPHVEREQQSAKIFAAPEALLPIARYIAGLWPARFFPDDFAAQCYALAEATDGYWIFSEQGFWETDAHTPSSGLHGPAPAYWEAMQTANTHLLNPDAQTKPLPDIQASSFYHKQQKQLVTPDSLPPFLDEVVRAAPRSPASIHPHKPVTYRQQALFHCLPRAHSEPAAARISHVRFSNYSTPTSARLFDAAGNLFAERIIERADQPLNLDLPADMQGYVSLLLDSGLNGARVSFSNLACVVEASSTFPLRTIHSPHSYQFSVAPHQDVVRLRAACARDEAATLIVESPNQQVSQQFQVGEFFEVNFPIPRIEQTASPDAPAAAELSLMLQDGQVIPMQDKPTADGARLWTITIQLMPFKRFEDVMFYFADTVSPYLLLSHH